MLHLKNIAKECLLHECYVGRVRQFTRNEVWDLVPRPKDANVSEIIELELCYTHDFTTSLKGSYDTKS